MGLKLMNFTIHFNDKTTYEIQAHDFKDEGQVVMFYRLTDSSESGTSFEIVAIIAIHSFTFIEVIPESK